MFQLVGVLPVTRCLRRNYTRLVTNALRSNQADASGRYFAATIQPRDTVRMYSSSSKKLPPAEEDNEKKEAEEIEESEESSENKVSANQDKSFEDEDVLELEESEEDLLPVPLANALIRATVPENVPEVIAVPIDRRPVFPGFYKTFTVKDERVAEALKKALKKGTPYVGLFLSKNESLGDLPDAPQIGDHISNLDEVYRVGTFAQLVNVMPSKNAEGITAIVYPHRRIRALELLPESPAGVSRVRVENFKNLPYNRGDQTIKAMMHEVFTMLTEVAKLNPFFREHITHHNVPSAIFEEPSKLADFIAVLSSSNPAELQEVLEAASIEERLRMGLVLLRKEIMTAELQSTIRKEVEAKLNKRQREYLLHEQLKTIKKELGLETDTKEKLTEMFLERVKKLQMPEEVRRVFDEELEKLGVLEPAGSEFNVTRNYLDWLTQLPWGKNSSEEAFDLVKAAQVLDEDHYGLKDVKDRILEFIAVAKLKGTVSGKILCLVGPPGVGKTSIGRSIARALSRQYYRFSVGGLGDVAEIKGHRRTYVGAMPGKIIQALKKVQTENPLILIDEIDKLGRGGHQGDPSSALLELLDPEQNNAFLDHYMDVSVDLSRVLFVCTANAIDTIPGPLLDRMEVINLSGYVAQEKMEIAKKYLVPSARDAAGLTPDQVAIQDETIDVLNKAYCRESGVRNLKKHIEKLYRKAALKLVQEPKVGLIEIAPENLKEFVGSPVFTSERMYEGELLPPGVVTGLAWTSMGGSILYIETLLEKLFKRTANTAASSSDEQATPQLSNPGLIRTGQLGKVMEESSTIAYSYAKAFLSQYHHEAGSFFQHAAVHLHVPEGATPKDGPSAGCTMTTALLSLALNRPIRSDLAMTGELSLTGKVLRIGGVKEKTIAAKRAGVKTILLPASNQSDWEDLPDYVKEGIEAKFVETYPEIAKITGLL